MPTFAEVVKELNDYYSDDERWFLQRHGDEVFFCESNHHNAVLFVMMAEVGDVEFCETVEAIRNEQHKDQDYTHMAYGGIPYVIKLAMKKLDAVVVGTGHED